MSEQTVGILAGVQRWQRGADEEPLAGAATILFVEDEAFVRDVTSEVLRRAGHEVLTAQNAAEGARIFEARQSDVKLLLTDVVLPGESGGALAGRLRRKNPELKVLLVTGYAEQMGAREGAQTEFLAKPFSAEELLGRVRGLLDGEGVAEHGSPGSERGLSSRETAGPSTPPSHALGSGRDDNLIGRQFDKRSGSGAVQTAPLPEIRFIKDLNQRSA